MLFFLFSLFDSARPTAEIIPAVKIINFVMGLRVYALLSCHKSFILIALLFPSIFKQMKIKSSVQFNTLLFNTA